MKALIMILKNIKNKTFHPIIYRESPFPGDECKVIRYKSVGHRTEGLNSMIEAVKDIEENLIQKLQKQGYSIVKELDDIIVWDGNEIPVDVQLR